jgi:hypothetical protein
MATWSIKFLSSLFKPSGAFGKTGSRNLEPESFTVLTQSHSSNYVNKFFLNTSIVKQCFWILVKFISEDSNAIHTIITTG